MLATPEPAVPASPARRDAGTSGPGVASTTAAGTTTAAAEREQRTGTQIQGWTDGRNREFAVVAGYPAQNDTDGAYRQTVLFTREDVTSVSSVTQQPGGRPSVEVELTETAADRFVTVMTVRGFTDDGTASCRWDDSPDDPGWCIFTVLDGEVIYAAGLGEGLAQSVESGAYAEEPSFLLLTEDEARAEELRAALLNETA